MALPEHKEKLQSIQLLQEQWQNIFFNFRTALALMTQQEDSTVTVVDKATRIVDLVPCKKGISTSEATQLAWKILYDCMV